MEKLTRRAALGLGTSALGLAACGGGEEPKAKAPKPYAGTVSFDHGVASGDPLSDRIILWTRVTPADPEAGNIPVKWSLREAGSDTPAHSGIVYAKRSGDWCVKVDAEGLSPDTAMTYTFEVETASGTVQSGIGATRTAPLTGGRDIRLVVISCSNFPFGRFNVYEAISQQSDLDAIVHLGDYLYEYGPDGYGGETGAQIGRPHAPPHEIISLDDYRARHAQYKSDPQLQKAHATAPWICTWDDHESTNNSYRTGAENHNPENGEGSWSDRKQAAIQAYMEWMPVREPKPGRARSAFWRRFDFGDVASILCLETRLTGRSEEISWSAEMEGVSDFAIPVKAADVMTRVTSDERTMLGPEQEEWLAKELKSSIAAGKAWQVLGNQTIMAKVRPPKFKAKLTSEQIEAQQNPLIQSLINFSQLGMPFNLDAWDGFPAARERLYQSAKFANARLVTVTGDTHTAWVNELHDEEGEKRGVEFGCTSVTSPGMGSYFNGVPELGDLFVEENEEVLMHRPQGHGFILMTLTTESVQGEFFEVSSILEEDFDISLEGTFEFTASDF